jgi:hypothetical protein
MKVHSSSEFRFGNWLSACSPSVADSFLHISVYKCFMHGEALCRKFPSRSDNDSKASFYQIQKFVEI